jgi:hypothetical protein
MTIKVTYLVDVGVGVSVIGARRRTGAAGGRLRAEEDGHRRGPWRRWRASLKGGGEAGCHRAAAGARVGSGGVDLKIGGGAECM